jgi:hypothetical protein
VDDMTKPRVDQVREQIAKVAQAGQAITDTAAQAAEQAHDQRPTGQATAAPTVGEGGRG